MKYPFVSLNVNIVFAFAFMLVFGFGLNANANANTNSGLPNAAYSGYWAMSQKVLGEYLVVRFQKQIDGNTLGTVYHFECNPDKSYTQIGQTHTQLVPTKDGLAVYESGKSVPSSYLKLYHHTPNKKLFLTQTFTDNMAGFKQLFPEGMILLYYPTNTPEPTCGTEPRKSA